MAQRLVLNLLRFYIKCFIAKILLNNHRCCETLPLTTDQEKRAQDRKNLPCNTYRSVSQQIKIKIKKKIGGVTFAINCHPLYTVVRVAP
jgi:hypothetical protein